MAVIILSMDVSDGYRKIRRALNSVAGVEDVEVYPDTGRVVVTGWADEAEVVTALESKLRVTVAIVNRQGLEFTSDEEDDSDRDSDSDSDDESSSGEEESSSANLVEHWAPSNPSPEPWMADKPEPWMADKPVPDPSSWFFNFNLRNN